ncbi:MAG TPA: hypothetical protein VFK88_12885 [Gallionella sp.]|nr:hypothetical protein [Gallionella sp.]
MEAELHQRIAAATDIGVALLAALRERVAKLALPGEPITIPAFESAKCTLEYDLYNSQKTLMASFYASPHYRNGVLLFHCDGSCYAEFHVMRKHPARPGMFIEAVEAWVRDGKIQTDTRIAMMPK